MPYDERLADRLRDHLAGEPGLTEKKMFGGLAFMIHGNMAVAASSQGGLLLRVDPDLTEELVTDRHAELFEMSGRTMRGWLAIDAAGLHSEADLARWTDLGVAFVRALPPK